ncbi:hypothetical protein GLX_19000 [Komagataeibacter medellinensis NBRC 3288]|uniref:Uncharacterized protein n=1 Tax=Komagataeibacter medellinensis (strain NBRC 3288 / BCRC 11682 / LMG 1693 / Kondo 51) TaxID=634177 RepID=G2I054_KOMMN|nr:hypothetical protein GLX_19000 [Komagataeibacter medellinensis NBRC 3288]
MTTFFVDQCHFNLPTSLQTDISAQRHAGPYAGRYAYGPFLLPWRMQSAYRGKDRVMHTLTLVLATAAIVAGMATSNGLRPARSQSGDSCVLTCMLHASAR